MKTLLTILTLLAAISATGREPRRGYDPQNFPRFGFCTTIGTGFSLGKPASRPLLWQLSGHYNISRRFAAGAGTGVSCYEKVLIPLFANLRFLLTRPRKVTPFLQCGAGYAFAPARDAKGGLFLGPAIGVQYALRGRISLLLALGYEIQQLERLKNVDNEWFMAQFTEKLHHNSITIKTGIRF